MIANKQIVWYPIDELQPWAENPNIGDVGAIVNSILRFGFRDELDVYGTEVFCGNHRLEAVKDIRRMYNNGERVEAIDRAIGLSTRLRINGDAWELGLDDLSNLETREEAIAYALAHNKINRLGYDDEAALLAVMDTIRSYDHDLLPITGWDYEDYGDINARQDLLVDEYEAPLDMKELTEDLAIPQGTAFLMYISFPSAEEMFRAMECLSFGTRKDRREGTRYVAIDGQQFLDLWETHLENIDAPNTD